MKDEVPPSPRAAGLHRDPALVPLSRDHHFALRQALGLRRAAEGGDADKAVRVARDFLDFHLEELAPHIADEEEALFPVAEGIDAAATERLRREHREIDALVARLAAVLVAGEEPRAVMHDIAVLLHDHVRYEERAYFMEVQERLPAELLRQVGAAISMRRVGRPSPHS